jgi:hypothetical protein
MITFLAESAETSQDSGADRTGLRPTATGLGISQCGRRPNELERNFLCATLYGLHGYGVGDPSCIERVKTNRAARKHTLEPYRVQLYALRWHKLHADSFYITEYEISVN